MGKYWKCKFCNGINDADTIVMANPDNDYSTGICSYCKTPQRISNSNIVGTMKEAYKLIDSSKYRKKKLTKVKSKRRKKQ